MCSGSKMHSTPEGLCITGHRCYFYASPKRGVELGYLIRLTVDTSHFAQQSLNDQSPACVAQNFAGVTIG